jgi:hypothetical protein
LSDAVNVVIDTVSELDVAGTLKPVTVGAAVSGAGGSVIVTVALRLFDTLLAASFAQAYSVFVPALPKV